MIVNDIGIDRKVERKSQRKNKVTQLKMSNKSTVNSLGLTTLNIKNPRTDDVHEVTFVIVHDEFECLLGLQTVQKLNCVTINSVERGILEKVEEQTVWVSQMAVVRKSNGKMRICIDPYSLNKVLVRERYKLPTFEDILPELHNAKIFTKLDVKKAFYHVKLTEESSKLTTMITPFGSFKWKRLPFRVKYFRESYANL